jgi:hypothetical protein
VCECSLLYKNVNCISFHTYILMSCLTFHIAPIYGHYVTVCFVWNVIPQVSYLLTPWSRVLLEKLTVLELVKKFPAFYGTLRFLTALTSAQHLSLSWASQIQSSRPHPTSWRAILIILPSAPGSPQRSLSLRFPHQNPVHTSPLPHTCYMPRPSHSHFLSPAQYLVRSTYHSAPHYVIFSIPHCLVPLRQKKP